MPKRSRKSVETIGGGQASWLLSGGQHLARKVAESGSSLAWLRD